MTSRVSEDELVARLRQAGNGFFPQSPLGDYGVCDEAAYAILTIAAERDAAWAAMRWVYENGMKPDHSRPEWVSDAFSDAYAPVRASQRNSNDTE